MNEILLLSNPRKRSGGRKRRSAAQRAATRRMLAANRMRSNPAPKRRKRRKSASRVARRASPVVSHRRHSKRSRRSFSGGRVGGSIVSMLKTGAFAGGGAVVADIGMGLVAKFAPTLTQITSRTNADGSTNYGYYAGKLAIIYAMNKYGSRVTRHAPTMAAGALAVLGYELIRGMIPADSGIPLGFFNPGRLVQGAQLGGVGRIIRNAPGQTMGRVMNLPNNAGRGAAAADVIRSIQAVNGLARR